MGPRSALATPQGHVQGKGLAKLQRLDLPFARFRNRRFPPECLNDILKPLIPDGSVHPDRQVVARNHTDARSAQTRRERRVRVAARECPPGLAVAREITDEGGSLITYAIEGLGQNVRLESGSRSQTGCRFRVGEHGPDRAADRR